MTVTPNLLTRWAGIAAATAGAIFIGVQINHPDLDATTIQTTTTAAKSAVIQRPVPMRSLLSMKEGPLSALAPPAQPGVLRIQSAVCRKDSRSRARSFSSTPTSPIAWSMQATHWSRSRMPILKGMWRIRRRG